AVDVVMAVRAEEALGPELRAVVRALPRGDAGVDHPARLGVGVVVARGEGDTTPDEALRTERCEEEQGGGEGRATEEQASHGTSEEQEGGREGRCLASIFTSARIAPAIAAIAD